MRDASAQGRSSKRKGSDGERELSNLLNARWGLQTKRGQVFNHQSDIINFPGIHPEVKRVEKLNVQAAMDQAILEAEIRSDGIPTVFHRRSRKEWLVTMRLEDWMKLYMEWMNK